MTLVSLSFRRSRTPATSAGAEDQWEDAVQQLEQVFFLKDAEGGEDGDASAATS